MKTQHLLIIFLCISIATACNTSKNSSDRSNALSNNLANQNTDQKPTNILLIIADDLGKDAMPGYDVGNLKPKTPVLSKLMSEGIRFENFWAFPTCTPTRSSIITGKYGFRNDMTSVGNELKKSETSLFSYIEDRSPFDYEMAVIGKWHLSENADHPSQMKVPYYSGLLSGGVRDYSSWKLTENGSTSRQNSYITSTITDKAISWLDKQESEKPWFLWLAYTAPHTPFHLPPSHLHSNKSLSGDEEDIESNPLPYFHAMIEAMDTEIGRLMNSIPKDQLEETVVVFIGDNGSPNQVAQVYPKRRVKGSVYEGGVNVPLFVSGANINRVSEVEKALVNSTDIFTTIGELAGVAVTSMYDSKSFAHLLDKSSADGSTRKFLFSQASGKRKSGVAIRNESYKYIELINGTKEFYNLSNDPFEKKNLLVKNLNQDQSENHNMLLTQLDLIINGDGRTEENLGDEYVHSHDHGSHTHTHDETNNQTSNFSVTSGINCGDNSNYQNQVKIEVKGSFRFITSNAIPDHTIGAFPNRGNPHTLTPQNKTYKVLASPKKANSLTSVYKGTGLGIGGPAYEFGVAINGVKMEPSAAEFFSNPSSGDRNTNWPKEALSTNNRLGEDCNNAHVQPNGEYHYHGTPWGIVEKAKGDKMFLVGWAADGFPIYYKWAHKDPKDASSPLLEMRSSYRLKTGKRTGDGSSEPSGDYDGTYVRDYEYIKGLGDLDEANARYGITPEFQEGTYYYMITDEFPSISRFFIGTPDESFRLSPPQGGNRSRPQNGENRRRPSNRKP